MKISRNARPLLLAVALGAFYIGSSQPPGKLQQKYITREATAPAEVKNTLASQRAIIVQRKLEFNVSYTGVTNKTIAQITGEIEPTVAEISRVKKLVVSRQLSPAGKLIIKDWASICVTSKKTYDARNANDVTPVRNQQCGNCWSYSAVGAFEGSYLRVNSSTPINNVNASEQYAVSCSGGGSCSGGLAYKVFEWMVDNNKNLQTDAAMPDNGTNGVCPGGSPSSSYFATDWGVVDPSGDVSKIASVASIKEALCKYGPIAASVQVTGLFQNYAGGVFNETPSNYASPSSNHAIVIVGWDDDKGAWLIKNSWGTDWGIDGYMWIKYNTNNIGRRAAWVIARKNTPIVAVPVKELPVKQQ
jgi:cathepsin K